MNNSADVTHVTSGDMHRADLRLGNQLALVSPVAAFHDDDGSQSKRRAVPCQPFDAGRLRVFTGNAKDVR